MLTREGYKLCLYHLTVGAPIPNYSELCENDTEVSGPVSGTRYVTQDGFKKQIERLLDQIHCIRDDTTRKSAILELQEGRIPIFILKKFPIA